MSQSSEYQLRKESQARDKKVRRVSRHVIRNATRGKDEMPAVPGFQIPVLYDGEFDAIQANLEEQGILVAMSEKSYLTDDTGARLRVVSVEDQEIAGMIVNRNEKTRFKESHRAQKRIDKISKNVVRNVERGIFEMPAVPGLQIPVLYDGELDAVQANLERQGIGVAMSEESHRTDDTGARLRAKRF